VPFQRFLGEDATTVQLDLERAARRLDQPDLHLGEGRPYLGRQTGGPRLIVSDDAKLYSDTHGRNDSGA